MADPRKSSSDFRYRQQPEPEHEPHDKLSTTRIENAAQEALEKAMPAVWSKMDTKLDIIINRQAEQNTGLQLFGQRMNLIERIVFGGCTLIGVTVFGSLLALVIKH